MSDPVVLLSTGDVVGPAGGVTDNSMVLFSGTSGKLIKGNNAVVTAAGLALLDDVNAAAQRATLGLGNVDNTSDINKPISTATQTALNLKATIDSPTFTGDPKAPTPAQFDSSKSLVTMEALKRFGLQASGRHTFNSNQVLNAAHAGATIVPFGASPLVFSLPLASTFQAGARIEFFNEIAVNSATINRAGTDTIVMNGSNLSLTSVTLLPGDTLTLECNGAGWDAVSGSAQLRFSGAFAASLTANGYQKLPSGLIVQWGSAAAGGGVGLAVTFPITFPNAVFSLAGLAQAVSDSDLEVIQFMNLTTAGFTTYGDAGRYIAIGY